jgi:subtilisin family serine protease
MSIPLNAFGAAPLEIKFAHVEGEVLVKFNEWIPAAQRRGIHQSLDTYVVSTIPTIHVQRVAGLKGQSAAALLHAFSNLPEVEYVEPNGIFTVTVTPDDEHYHLLWGLENTGQVIRDGMAGIYDADIDASDAWDLTTGSPDIVVAVIDTGVDIDHFDLRDNIWVNPGEIPGNEVDDDGNGYIDDINGWNFVNSSNNIFDDRGHGTHVSGTIAAQGNNGIGVTGVSWQSSIMGLKFLSDNGTGTWEDAAEAILYAASMGVRISNNSWGCQGDCFSQVVEDAIQVASEQGMLFVVAAGNNNVDNDVIPQYPCNSEIANVLCVAATDPNDIRAAFSNYGRTSVDLGAPGVDIVSTFPANRYVFNNGTSMATPHVAGAAALVLAQNPTLPLDKLKRILMSTTDPVESLKSITVTGGRLNAYQAVISKFTVAAEPDTVTVNKAGQSAEYTVTVESFQDFSAPINLSAEAFDPDLVATFAPDQVTPPANGQATSTLTVSTINTGPESITVIGTDPATGDTRSDLVTLIVKGAYFDMTSTVTKLGTISSGAAATIDVTITSVSRYDQPVTLSFSSDQPGLTGTFGSNPLTPPKDGSVSTTLSITADATVPIASHAVRIQATDGKKTRLNQETVVVAEVEGIDLVMTRLEGQATAATRSGSAFLPFSVRNRGTEKAENTCPPFTPCTHGSYQTYFSLDTNLDVNEDILVDSNALTRPLQPLDSFDGVIDMAFALTGPVQDQTYYYIFTVMDHDNKFVEADEQNNTIMADQQILMLNDSSDLIASDLVGPAAGVAGAKMSVSALLSNIGIGQATSSSGPHSGCDSKSITFFLSSDTTVDPLTDIKTEGATTCQDLLPGASLLLANLVKIPATVIAGDYYLAAYVDIGNSVVELDETNNGFLGEQITISQQADLAYSSIGVPASARRGDTISVVSSIANLGSADASNFRVGIYIKPLLPLEEVNTDDLLLGDRTVVSLPAQGTDQGATDVVIPSNLKRGVYRIGFIADDTDVVSEFDENNNTSLYYLGRIEVK